MKSLEFDCIEEFVAKVDADYDTLTGDYKDLSIIAKYDEAVEIVKVLMCFDYNIRSIRELSEPDFAGYEDEFVISLTSIDMDREVWCEPMVRENGYISDESTITYVMDNCSSQCLAHCAAPLQYEVCIEGECEDCECEADCLGCDLDKCVYEKEDVVDEDNDRFKVTIKVNMDIKEAEEAIDMIEKRFAKMNEEFERMFSWGKLLW